MNSNDQNPNRFFKPQPNLVLSQALTGISRDISDLAHRLRQVENQEKPGAFTAGSVLFGGSDGRLTQDNANLSWDDTNNRLTVTGRIFLGAGTSFPASPPTNGEYFRTDLGFLCYYDGTRWLTAHEIMIPVQALTTFTGPGTVAGTITALRTDYAPYFTRVEMTTVVATTNNGANYWTIDLIGIDLTFTVVSLITNPNTSTDAMGVRVNHAAAAGAPTPSNRQFIRGRFTTTGSPGQLEMTMSTWYRLIIT